MKLLLQLYHDHQVMIGYVAAAFITAWPQHRADFSWYGYLWDVSHNLLPITQRRTQPTIPT